MIHHAKLSYKWWPEAIYTANYITNRLPTASLQNITPFESVYNIKPNLSNLRVFGCKAYTLIEHNQRSKLDSKSKECIYLGPAENSPAHNLYNLSTKHLFTSKDVIFDEFNFINKPNSIIINNQPIFRFNTSTNDKLSISTPNIIKNSNHMQNTEGISPAVPIISKNTLQILTNIINTPKINHENSKINVFDGNLPKNIRQSTRIRKIVDRQLKGWGYTALATTVNYIEPKTLKEALASEHAEQWKAAINSEYKSIMDNSTWELTPLPPGRKAIDSKWLFKVKMTADGNFERFKARLVGKGYSQIPGLDYNETFAPVT
jgi:hypothetical protein